MYPQSASRRPGIDHLFGSQTLRSNNTEDDQIVCTGRDCVRDQIRHEESDYQAMAEPQPRNSGVVLAYSAEKKFSIPDTIDNPALGEATYGARNESSDIHVGACVDKSGRNWHRIYRNVRADSGTTARGLDRTFSSDNRFNECHRIPVSG